VCKVATALYRCQFYYSETEQYGTGRDEYDDIGTCVLTLLQVQSDHTPTGQHFLRCHRR